MVLFSSNGHSAGNTPVLQVLPWNGKSAAVTLTFDDADPSHLNVAIPALDKYGFKGTFFLIGNVYTKDTDSWEKAARNGHEMGNHSWSHPHIAGLSTQDLEREVVTNHNAMEKTFGPVFSFAYPFTEITPELKEIVGRNHFFARGGYGNYYISPDTQPDWLNLPAQATLSTTSFMVYQDWMDTALSKKSWAIFMIHGLEGTPWGWQPISAKVFDQILTHLKKNESTIWTAPLGTVGAYFMAQKIIEKSVPVQTSNGFSWKWSVPKNYPSRTLLKVKLPIQNWRLFQQNNEILPDSESNYSINFNLGELDIRQDAKSLKN